jgi:hypothetical protein
MIENFNPIRMKVFTTYKFQTTLHITRSKTKKIIRQIFFKKNSKNTYSNRGKKIVLHTCEPASDFLTHTLEEKIDLAHL